MEHRQTKEALLRHLLDGEISTPDEKTIYSYLLGYRLFQTPENLLKEIQCRIKSPESSETGPRFLRKNQKAARPKDLSACSKCQRRRQNPKTVSKSTNNMLENDPSPLYVEMLRANVMMQGPKRPLPKLSDSQTLSPNISTSGISSDTLAKPSDFDDYRSVASGFDEDNRRNTAPPAALRALPSPHKLNKAPSVNASQLASNYASTASMGAILEKLPETNIDEVPISEDIIAMGDDTIRRRRKGRRRPEPESLPSHEPLKTSENTNTDRRSVASRDSGILSGLLDHEIDSEYQSSNINNSNSEAKSDEGTSGQSGNAQKRLLGPTLPASDSLDQLAKDIESQICEHLSDDSNLPNSVQTRNKHLLKVLLIWVRDFPGDFKKNETSGTLKELINNLANDSQELKDHCSSVLETLNKSSEGKTSVNADLKSDTLPRDEHFQDTKEAMIAMVTGMSDAGDANKVAEQLCLIEMDLLSHLGAEEFLQVFNNNKDEEANCNLGASVRWFNHLSHLVATSVCLCRKPKHRRQVISLFTRTAATCYQLSNFNSAMAILTGLSLGAVARLKRTWSKVDVYELEQLQAVFDPSNNFRRYRKMFNARWAAMRDHQESDFVKPSPEPENHRYSTASQHSVSSRLSVASVTSQHRDSGIECENDSSAKTTPVTSSSASSTPQKRFTFDEIISSGLEDGVLVPFLTLMVKDVYFLNHSTPTIEPNGTINFEKIRHLGEILHPLETWKNKSCVYKKNAKLQDFLLNSPVLKDAELYNLSYKREPPKNKFEKNQLKTIRTELEYSKRGNVVRRMIARRKTM